MGKGKKAQDAKAVLFKRLYGVKPAAFIKMVSILQKEFGILHKQGGKPPKPAREDKLYAALKYLRQYPAMDSLAAEYSVCRGSICPAVQWVENTPVKDGASALPEKRVLKRKSASIEYIAADVTESPIGL